MPLMPWQLLFATTIRKNSNTNMYAYFKGTIVRKTTTLLVIECGGVGYEVNIPLSTYDKLPQVGDLTELQIHYSFNESDGTRLFGFFTEEEKYLFRKVISISKIGPKLGLAILSGLSVEDFVTSVHAGDVSRLSTISGIGKKSAERLIIELKDKLDDLGITHLAAPASGDRSSMMIDAEAALVSLGYRPHEVRKAISEILKEEEIKTSEALIKATMKSLYKKRNI